MFRPVATALLAACLAACGGGGSSATTDTSTGANTSQNTATQNTTPGTSPGTTPSISPAAASWWQPSPPLRWQIQYTGTLDTSLNVDVYDIDLFDTPAATIQTLHAQSKRVICYFSAGSYENWRPDAGSFPASVLGLPLEGWAGEQWLDISNIAALGPIMEARLDLAVSKGCDGVDPDNVDTYTQDSGFTLSAAQQITYNSFLATQAHARNLAIGLKNDLDQVTDLVGDFDYAVNESCYDYDECSSLTPFISAGKPVFSIEYAEPLTQFCPVANQLGFDAIRKDLALDAGVGFCS